MVFFKIWLLDSAELLLDHVLGRGGVIWRKEWGEGEEEGQGWKKGNKQEEWEEIEGEERRKREVRDDS